MDRVHAFVLSAAIAFSAGACNGDEGDGGGAGGAGGAAGATGGMNAAGMTGGMNAGGMSGGMNAGGMTGGGAGAGGEGGTSGTGATMNEYPGCDAAMAGEPAALHAAALAALAGTTEKPGGGCGFDSCHNSRGEKAGLVMLPGDNLNMKLVDVDSCENTTMPLVKSGGGDIALLGSWLWQKLAAPKDADYNVIANPEWGAPVMSCGQSGGTGFGARMPASGGLPLSDERLAAIRNWICAGAPPP